jgi:hypothetical protein
MNTLKNDNFSIFAKKLETLKQWSLKLRTSQMMSTHRKLTHELQTIATKPKAKSCKHKQKNTPNLSKSNNVEH